MYALQKIWLIWKFLLLEFQEIQEFSSRSSNVSTAKKAPPIQATPSQPRDGCEGKAQTEGTLSKGWLEDPEEILEFDRNSQIFWNLLALKRFLNLMQNHNFEEIFNLYENFLTTYKTSILMKFLNFDEISQLDEIS